MARRCYVWRGDWFGVMAWNWSFASLRPHVRAAVRVAYQQLCSYRYAPASRPSAFADDGPANAIIHSELSQHSPLTSDTDRLD
jgi:hypothetical protein